MKTVKILSVTTLILSLLSANTALAFDNNFWDQADTNAGSSVALLAGRSAYVRESNTRASAFFATNTGTKTLEIRNANWCSSNVSDALDEQGNGSSGVLPSVGENVTSYVFTYTNTSGGTTTIQRYGKARENCGRVITVDISDLGSNRFQGTNYYAVNIDIEPLAVNGVSRPGIMNGYNIHANGTENYVGIRSGSSGYTATADQRDTSPAYLTYRVPFGTDCRVTSGYEDVDLVFYDLDNAGGAGAQPVGEDVTIRLYDITQGDFVNINGNGQSWGSNTVWTPPSKDNDTQSRSFRAYAGHKYELSIRNVHWNNTIQYSIPYAQIHNEECPKSATITTGASADNTDANTSVADNQVRLSVSTSDLVDINAETFSWYTEYNRNGGTWNRITPASGATSTNIAGPGTVVSEEYTVPTAAGNYCYRIIVTKPSFASWGAGGDNEVCFNVVQVPVYSADSRKVGGSTTAFDYEKGGPAVTFNHNINITTFPCDYTQGINNGTWVNQINWSADGFTEAGPPAISSIGNSSSGTLRFENCGDQILINGVTPVSGSGTIYNLTSYSVNSATDLDTLNNSDPGTTFGRKTFVQNGNPNESRSTFMVYEAPFSRFFGGDVMICGDGSNNRFIYDSASPNTSTRRGSFSEYASIYLSNNNPRSDYQGLNSASLISSSSWYDYLKSYWNSTDLCDNGLVPSDDIIVSNAGGITINATNYATSRTIYNSNAAQAITINGNISVSPPSDPTDPKTYNVVLIYSAGDINITSNAGSIEAILIAEGTIRTCSDALSATDLSNKSKCVKPLKITGAVSAGTVKLQRTGGTRFKAQDNNNDRSVRYLDLTSASEIIEYPWYLSYVNLDLKDRSGNNFDAYFSLPPRL